MLCSYEIEVQGSDKALPLCLRVLLLWNTEKTQREIHHVYQGAAKQMRPDLPDLPAIGTEEKQRWFQEQGRTGAK